MENWGDEFVTSPRLTIDLRVLFTSNLAKVATFRKRVNCLYFQTCIASSAVPIWGTFSGGTVEALVFCSCIASSTQGPR